MQLDVTSAGTDMHSGMKGGSVPNAARVVAALVAKLHDDKTHKVLVPGFYEVGLTTLGSQYCTQERYAWLRVWDWWNLVPWLAGSISHPVCIGVHAVGLSVLLSVRHKCLCTNITEYLCFNVSMYGTVCMNILPCWPV